jgi:hypothetical protein
MIDFAGGIFQCLVRILPTWHLQPLQRNNPVLAPTGTARRAQNGNANEKEAFNSTCSPCLLCCGYRRFSASRTIEQFASFEHSVHDDCKFARDRNGRPLEPDPLPELQAVNSLAIMTP